MSTICVVPGCTVPLPHPSKTAKYCPFHALEEKRRKARERIRENYIPTTKKCIVPGCNNTIYRNSKGCKDHVQEAKKLAIRDNNRKYRKKIALVPKSVNAAIWVPKQPEFLSNFSGWAGSGVPYAEWQKGVRT